MFVFQVQLDSKKVSREQMLDYLAQTSKGVSFEVSEAEARRFLSGKFEGREWFSDLMSRVRFESKLAYNFSEGSALVHLGGTYVRPQASGNFGKLMILRYPVNVDDIFDSHEFSEKLKELHGSEGAAKIISNFYKHAANSSNPFSLLDDASLTALYSLVRHHEQRAQDAVRRSLDSYVHEVGHAVLHQVVGSERYAGPDQAAVRAYLSSHVRDANYVPVVEGIEAFYLRDGILEDFGGLERFLAKDFSLEIFHPKVEEMLELWSKAVAYDKSFLVQDVFVSVNWAQLESHLRRAGVSEERLTVLRDDASTRTWHDLETIGGFKVETYSDGSATVKFSAILEKIYCDYGVSGRDFKKIEARLRVREEQSDITDELFARLFDGLVTGQTAIGHSGEKIAPSDSDLKFFSTLSYNGQPMLAREIDAFKQAREKTREEFSKEKKE